jgi:hypothetical protein
LDFPAQPGNFARQSLVANFQYRSGAPTRGEYLDILKRSVGRLSEHDHTD